MVGCMMRWLLRSAGWAFLMWYLLTGSPRLTVASGEVSPAVSPNGMASLPLEPDEFDHREVEAYYDWRNNLFFRRFNLTGVEDVANFMTARRTYKVSTNQYGYEVAVTFANPLFYWLDRNGNGEFEPSHDEMWIDIEEDGINGNEKLYDPMVRDDAPRGPVPSPPVPSPRGKERSM
jgi:hypothetical protein